MLQLEKAQVNKLLCARSPDAALLYLYLQSGGDPAKTAQNLGFNETRHACAMACLHQLGLWQEKPVRLPGEQPQYSELDVMKAMDTDVDFRALYEEVQRLLGRNLNTEELKILLGFVRYLDFSADMIVLLICYCKNRARKMGKTRAPSLRTIEKEAYAWAERGIDTPEEAAVYTRQQELRYSQVGRIMEILQIRGRNLTAPERRYIKQWLEMGFDESTIGLAYERSCLNTGGLSWPYINKILLSWQEQGLRTAQQVQTGERKPGAPQNPNGQMGQAELAAIQRMMKEG